MGNRLFVEDVTVWSWNGDGSILNQLGDGSITTDVTLSENRALKDYFPETHPTSSKTTVTFELASEDSDINFAGEAMAYGSGNPVARNFVFTRSDSVARTYTCWITNVSEKIGTALRMNVTLEMTGAPV